MIFTINSGSSSVKFAIFENEGDNLVAEGAVERIGQAPHLKFSKNGEEVLDFDINKDDARDNPSTLKAIFRELKQAADEFRIDAIGHRIVHGGPNLDKPVVIDDIMMDQLLQLSPFAPLHQPHNIAGVQIAREEFPDALQVGCFDTAFHRHHPFVNDAFAIPRRYYDMGVRRYGFHGLSYEYITSKLKADYPELHKGRVVVCHLGSGASMCAISNGQSKASTMGFSALDGLPMGTRCGQIDPEVVLFLMEHENMTTEEVTTMLYKESGLLGMSGVSNDIRDLDRSDNPHARQAMDYFAFRIRRELGAMAATLGGLDAVVFTGGIGEHHAWTRRQACQGMEFMGIALDIKANEANAAEINGNGSVKVLVLPTSEELVIARSTQTLLN